MLLAKRPAEVEVYNDLNGELVNFFRVLKEQPAEFKASWKWCLVSREEFYRLRDADTSTMTAIERAYRFLYLNKVAFGGDMARRPRFGVSARDPHGLNPLLDTLDAWVDSIHQRLRRAWIENLPWQDLLARIDGMKTSEPVYFLDPPYLGTYGYTTGTLSEDDHRTLAAKLGTLKGRFLLTINDHPLVRGLYDGCNMLERSKTYSISRSDEGRREYQELIISNYPLPTQKQAAFW